MECDRCGRDAVMHAEYSGAHHCAEHVLASVEKRVRRRIRSDGLVSRDATPDDPDRWVIGLSGGKDSVVLTWILEDLFSRDRRIEIVALTIHEGIEGYRDESVDACIELAADLGIRHELVSYEEEFGIRMDDIVDDDPVAYCGVLRRDLLETDAEELEVDLLLTGHNIDDEAQTALMDVPEGNVEQMAERFHASLGPSGERIDRAGFVSRAKPLRDIPEKEVALYAHLRDLPAHITECPHASEAFRGEIRELLLRLEEHHPGTRHSIVSGYEEMASMAASRYRGESSPELRECAECGSQTTREVCRTCRLLESIRAV